MENFDYTISIGQLGEQLTLNQWVLGSSPRWCTKSKPPWRDMPLRLYPRRALLAGSFPGDSPAL